MEQHEGGQEPQQPQNTGSSAEPRRISPGLYAPDAADRLSTLTHELRNLLDGSMRWLSLARGGLHQAAAAVEGSDLERTGRQIDTVRVAMARMAELISVAGSGKFGTDPAADEFTLADAARHAMDVVRPRAAGLGVTLGADIDEASADAPTGPMYSVLLNGLVNALESIEQALGGQPGEGLIALRLHIDDQNGTRYARLEIEDSGVGPPVSTDRDVFDPLYSTRTGTGPGRGIGLALSKSLVEEAGGGIELIPREGNENTRRPGAILRAWWRIDAEQTP